MSCWSAVPGEGGIKLFICYRRQQDTFGVDLIRRRLIEAFGPGSVFIDVHGIPLGNDFRVVLEEGVSSCDVLLVMITDGWLALQHADGRRQLDTKHDFVRFEIETALSRGIHIVPVLLGKATMPSAQALPASINELAYREAVQIRQGIDCDTDLNRFTEALRQFAAGLESVRKERSNLIASVERGDWLLAGQMRGSASVRKELQAAAQYRNLEELRREVEQLRDAAVALDVQDLRSAHAALTEVAGDAPPIVNSAKAFAALGVRLCEPMPDAATLRDIAAEFREIVQRSPQGVRVPGERQVSDMLQRMLRDADYQEALRLYDQAAFDEAAARFAELDYRDAKDRLARCSAWLTIFDHVRAQRWDEARRTLKTFLDRWEEPRARDVLKWCNFAGRVVPSLRQLAAGGAIAEDYVLWDGGLSPYKLLHVAPKLTLEQCNNELGYALQEQPGGMTELQRVGLDALRLIHQRLIADFSLYTVRNPERADRTLHRHFVFAADEPDARVLARIQDVTSQLAVETIAAELGEDSGILHALTRSYDAAIDAFLEVARRTPWEPRALHHLGLAAYAKIRFHRDTYEGGDVWETVAAAWGAVFADTRFWHAWWSQRRAVYPVSNEEQVSSARSRLKSFLLEELKSAGDVEPGLADMFRIELNAARATAVLGGIPVGSGTQARVVTGPRGVAAMGLEKALASWIGSFPLESLSRASEQRSVCVAFSTIAPAQLLFEEGAYEEAIAILESDDGSNAFAARNPGFASTRGGRGRSLFQNVRRSLLQQAHMKAAVAAVSEVPVNLDDAVTHWNKALSSAGSVANRAELRAEIGDVVAGRCHVLRDEEREGPSRLESLNDAVRLAQEALQNWDDAEGLLRQTLADSLLERAKYVSNEFDMEKEARDDALRACGLTPESLHAITVLCGTSIHYARELHQNGKSDLAEALVREVQERLAEAEKLFPGNSDLQKSVRVAGEMAELLAGGSNAVERALEKLGKIAGETNSEPADSRLAQAMVLEAQSDFPRAVELYWQLVQSSSPGERELIGRLSWCYRRWLIHLRESGDNDGYRRVARDATTRCPSSAALTDFIDALPPETREIT